MTEVEVFAAMKRLAVREENTMVARVTQHNMRRNRISQCTSTGLDWKDKQVSASLLNNVQNMKPP